MFLRLFLCLLYTLQLVVLSEMVSAYLSIIPNTKSLPPPPPQTAPPTPQTAPSQYQTAPAPPSLLQKIAPENVLPASHRNKQSVRLKPISLAYLREHLPRVSSRLDLVRLFTDTDDDGANLDRWVSRTLQSASDTGNHRPHRDHGLLKEKSETTHLPEIIRVDKLTDDPTSESFESMDESSARDKNIINEENDEVADDKNAEESDYFLDYSQEESSEGDFEAFEAALHHMEEINTCSSSRCRQPTPYVLRVRDPQDDTRVFLPECVVLHRCQNHSGCCGDSNHECVPKLMSVIYKAFLVVDRLVGEYVTFHPKMATTISFVNHTECECREKPKLPTCTKTCPTHLRLTQEGVNCVCDCFPQANLDSWPCDSVRDGVARLSHDGLMCIRNGNCYVPRCSAGEFDINTGFCPLSDEYALPAFLFNNPVDRRFYRDHLQSFDFSNLPRRFTSTSNGWTISPTPSSASGGFVYTHQYTLESLTSRTVPTLSAPIRSSYEVVDSLEDGASALISSTRNSINISVESVPDKNNPMLVFNETHLDFSKSNASENMSISHLQSSHSTSFRDEDEIRSIGDTSYSDERAVSSESQSKPESSSQAEDDSTGNSQNLNDDSANVEFVSADARFPIEIVYDNDASTEMESPEYETDDSASKPLQNDGDESITSLPRINKHIPISHIPISHITTPSSSDHPAETFSRQTPIKNNIHRAFITSANFHGRFLGDKARLGAHDLAQDIHSNNNLVHAPTTASSLSSSSSALPLPLKLFSTSVTTSTSFFKLPPTSPLTPSYLPTTSSTSTDSSITSAHIPHNSLPSDTSRDNDTNSGSAGETPAQHPP